MNPFEHYTLDQLKKRTSEKWSNYPEDVLPLWVAEMDIKPPQEMVEEINKVLEIGDLGYLSKKGFDRYTKAFTDFSKRHWGWEHNPLYIADVLDVVSGCKRVIDAYLEHDSSNSVIVSTPIYPPFINKYTSGYQYHDAPLNSDGRLDFDILEEKFSYCTKNNKKAVYALCNPSNPTGTVHTEAELRKLALLSLKYGVLLISDEIHGALVTERNFEHDGHLLKDCDNVNSHGKHSSFVPLLSIEEAGLAVTVTSASKAFSIPAMKAALVIPSSSGETTLQNNTSKAQDLIWHSGQFGQATSEHFGALAQTICMERCDEYLYHLVQGVRNNIAYFESLAKRYFPLASFTPAKGCYFAWVDFSKYKENGKIPEDVLPSKYFREVAKVALNPGRTFATPLKMHWSGMPLDIPENKVQTKYDNFVRINLGTSQEIIRMACERISSVLD